MLERMPPRIFEGDGSAWDTTPPKSRNQILPWRDSGVESNRCCSKTIREHTENYLIFHIVFVLSEFISQYRTITGHCFWRAFHNQTLDPEAITLVVRSLKLGAALAQSRVSTRRSKAARKPCLRRCGQSEVRATAEPAL